jgi:hypothetical protein
MLMDALIAGREPAFLATLISIVINIGAAFLLDLNVNQQALLNAVVLAITGLIIAWTTHDGTVAGLLGVIQAVIALAVGLGLHLDPDNQALLMSAVATIAAGYTRTQVTAHVPAEPFTPRAYKRP